MVTKMLIQVISVVTLVFGTCYQSVQALASNTKRIDIQSARLIDKDNTAPATVKAGSEHKLVVDLTISNKDGDHESGTTQFWVPQSQLELLKDEATFEANETAENAHLNYKKLANNQLQLSWDKVTNVANFRVALPVKVKQVMTESVLSIAVGRETSDLQPLTVLAADATDDAVGEITGDPGLPKAILADLDQYLDALRVQEEEAAAKREAEEQAKLEEAKKAEAEAKEKAEKEAAAKKEKEQQEVDKEKEAAKTETTMKTRSTRTTDRSDDGEGREGESATKAEGKNLGKVLIDVANDANKATDSFFDSITVKHDGEERVISGTSDDIDLSKWADGEFELIYNWDIESVKEKLSGTKINVGDYYTFRIKGLAELPEDGKGEIKDGSGKKLASYTYENRYTNGKYEYQEVKITLDEAIALDTRATFNMALNQKFVGGQPVTFEYNEQDIIAGVPNKAFDAIEKSGRFVGEQIEWTVTLKPELLAKGTKFKDITIKDDLGSGHKYVGGKMQFTVKHGDESNNDVTDQFELISEDAIKGKDDAETEFEKDLVITFYTELDQGTDQSTFENKVSAEVGKQKTNVVTEKVSTTEITKTGTIIENGNDNKSEPVKYRWQVVVDFKGMAITEESLKSLKITDALKGSHKFDETKLKLQVSLDKDNTQELNGFNHEFTGGDANTPHNQLVITVDSSKVTDLVTEIGSNEKLYFTYNTVQTDGDINAVENSAKVVIDGRESNTEGKGVNSKGDLISKDGNYATEYTNKQGNDTEGATINWHLTVNSAKREYAELTVIDTLPETLYSKRLGNFTIGSVTLATNKAVMLDKGVGGADDTMVTLKFGNLSANGTFVEMSGQGDVNAVELVFTNVKKDYRVDFSTMHDWGTDDSQSWTNRATATTTNNYSETTEKKVEVGDRITKNAFKDGQTQLTNSIDSGKNSVQWRIGFGTKLNDTFSKQDTKQVTIKDTLNGNGVNYLSFPTSSSAYTLYEIKNVGNDENSSELGNPIDSTEYKVTPTLDQNNATIVIDFEGHTQYHQLALVFETPIDLDAWMTSNTQDPAELKEDYVFSNKAVVNYTGFNSTDIEGKVSLSKNGVHNTKNGNLDPDNQRIINWQVILNASSKSLSGVEITDKLSDNHEHDTTADGLKLYTTDVEHKANNGALELTAVDTTKKELTRGEDYVVERNDHDTQNVTIKFTKEVTKPLLMEYKTIRKISDSSKPYTNAVQLSSKEVIFNAQAQKTFSSSGQLNSFDVSFKKIAGDDKDQPLAGAKFKLQEKAYTANEHDPNAWKDATDFNGNPIGEIVSPEGGYFTIRNLKTASSFRLIETESAPGFDHDIEPIAFTKADVDSSDWQTTKYYIQNWEVEKRSALEVNKAVTGLPNQSFNFKVSAKIGGNLDTSFNGEYPIVSSGAKVTFKNGIATFSLSKDETIKINELPVYMPGKDATTKRHYEIEEVLTSSDDFKTQVIIDTGSPKSGTTTGDIELKVDNQTAVYFQNSKTAGDFILAKQVSEADKQVNPDQVFNFNIDATEGGNAYDTGTEFAARKVKANGDLASETEQVTFTKGRLTKVANPNDEVVKLKANEQYMITGLPKDLSLTATELDPSGYQVTSRPAGEMKYENYKTGSVVTSDTQNTLITVINELPTGALKLNKDVLNQKAGDEDAKFEFTLTIKGKDALRGQTFFEVTGLKNQDDVKFEYDQAENQHLATLTLKHNDSATIHNLPKGVEVTITETIHSDFKTTYQVKGSSQDNQNGDWKDQADGNAVATVPGGRTTTISYENTRLATGKLYIEKKGNNLPANQEFEFKIKAVGNDTLNGEYEGTLTQSADNKGVPRGVTFDKGEANITLEAGQQQMIAELPLGDYVVSEKATAGLATSWKVTDQTGSNSDDTSAVNGYYQADPAKVTEKKAPEVIYTNSLITGKLAVSKQVSSNEDADLKAEYQFKVTATKQADKISDKAYKMVINGEEKRLQFTGDTAEFSLKDGQTAHISDLPVGVEFTVKEVVNQNSKLTAAWLIDGVTNDYQELTDTDVPAVEIDNNKTSIVSYKNTRYPVGELVVKKAIEGNINASQSFKFNVAAATGEAALTGSYRVIVYDARNEEVTNSVVNVQADQLTFNLLGGQWAVIKGLPLSKYQVEEVKPNVSGMTTSWTLNSSGEVKDGNTAELTKPLDENGRQTVAFTNAVPVNNLTLNKDVFNQKAGDENTEFEFTLTVEGKDTLRGQDEFNVTGLKQQNKIQFEYYPDPDPNQNPDKGQHQATLKLKHNDSATIEDLPIGVEVHITETLHADFETTYQTGDGNKKDQDQDGDGPTATISATKPIVVSYENTRLATGELYIEKIGKNLPTDQEFEFKIEAVGNNVLNGKFNGTLKASDGDQGLPYGVTFNNGEANTTLGAGKRLIISGLPLGDYVVSEKATDGLVTSWKVTGHPGSNSDDTPAISGYYEADPATVTEGTTPQVVYTNSLRNGGLTLNKDVFNQKAGDENIEFEFTLTVKGKDTLRGQDEFNVTGLKNQNKIQFEYDQAEDQHQAILKLKHNDSATIEDLPTGVAVHITEKLHANFETTYQTDGGDKKDQDQDGDGPTATISDSKPTVVSYENTRPATGKLQVNKHVASKQESERNATYKFDLEVDSNDAAKVNGNTYQITGNAKQPELKFDNGKAVLEVQGDSHAIVTGLPVGITVAVTERVENPELAASWLIGVDGNYQALTDTDYPKVKILADEVGIVSYKNTRDPDGQLRVEKQVTGAVADEDASYNFVIDALDITDPNDPDKLLDLNGTYSIQLYQSGTNKLLHDDNRHITFVDGQADLSLQADQYAVIDGLPLNTYRVNEDDPGVDNMTTTWSLNGGQMTPGLQTDTHELTKNGVMTVVFNNIVRTGDLSIEKQLTGAVTDADEQLTFDFTVTAHRDAVGGGMEVDTDYDRQHSATLTAADGTETTLRRDFENGELTVSLKAGERLTIHNLDENRVMKVTEEPLADFITTHRIGTDAVEAGSETREIKIADEVTKRVTFINDKPAMPEMTWLSLTKTVLGDAAETDRGFDFTIQLTDHLQEPVTGMVKIVTSTVANPAVSSELLLDENGMGTVTLQHNETIKVEVPNGATYQITETDYSADGYVTTTSHGGQVEQSGLMVTGIAHQVDPSKALVVYYNRADSTTTEDDLAHTDTEDDQAMPELVGPATDGSDSTGTGSGLTGSMPQAHTSTGGMGASGSVAPQAYTSSGSKGFLPQTGEFLRAHWVAVLGLLLLMVLIGMMVWRYRLNKR